MKTMENANGQEKKQAEDMNGKESEIREESEQTENAADSDPGTSESQESMADQSGPSEDFTSPDESKPGNGDSPIADVAENNEESSSEKEVPLSREEELEVKLAEMQDRYLRLSAEYDNYRKRTLKEKLDLQNTSREEVILKLLSVVDDFDRAMDSIESAKDMKAVKDGLKLIHGKFSNYLTQEGVKEIDAKNKAFDTDLHEAVTKIPVTEKKKKGKVVDVIEKGYTLKDKVIRFSKVVIGE